MTTEQRCRWDYNSRMPNQLNSTVTVRVAICCVVVALGVVQGTVALNAKLTPTAITITQPDSPLEISAHKTRVVVDEYILNEFDSKNRSTKNIVAVEYITIALDAFNRLQSTQHCVGTDVVAVGKSEKPNCRLKPIVVVGDSDAGPEFFSLSLYQTGLVYVAFVRFEDGSVWQADETAVLAEVKKVSKDFNAAFLRDRRDHRAR